MMSLTIVISGFAVLISVMSIIMEIGTRRILRKTIEIQERLNA